MTETATPVQIDWFFVFGLLTVVVVGLAILFGFRYLASKEAKEYMATGRAHPAV